MIHQTVEAIASELGSTYDVVSLAGKRINGCNGCTRCAADNTCKVQDDWNAIGEKMRQADIIIFGAPNYYGTINALGHACLERTFSFRHNSVFSLKDKIGITVSTSRSATGNDPVREMIERFMKSNEMEIVGHVTVEGYGQCYTCGYGHNCEVGSVVARHGVLENIEEKHLPLEVSEQPNVTKQIKELVDRLKKREDSMHTA